MIIYGKNYCVCVYVCVCVNSTFGRCCHCPCGKEEEKKTKGKETIAGIGFQLHEPYSNLKNELINNTDNVEQPETIKNEKNNKDGNESLENQNDNEKKLIDEIIAEALKNNVICNVCINTKDSESKIKLVFDDPAARDGGNPAIKTVDLGFWFCEKHKTCSSNGCLDTAMCLTFCGHRLCTWHLQSTYWYKCPDCNEYNCNASFVENFGKHIWCTTTEKVPHYVCFNNNLENSPFGKNDYNPNTWVCPDHQDK